MVLSKGFLKRDKLPPSKFSPATFTILWLWFSYTLYSFLFICRETVRLLSPSMTHHRLMVLSNEDTFIHNVFLASVASAFSLLLAIRIPLNEMFRVPFGSSMLAARKALNNLHFDLWTAFMVFFRFTSLLGIWYLTFPFQYEINFVRDYPLLLITIPVAVFLMSWSAMKKAFGWKMKQISIITICFLALSFILGAYHILDLEKLNHLSQKHRIDYWYRLDKPSVQSHSIVRNREDINVFVVIDTATQHETRIFINQLEREARVDNLASTLKEIVEQASYSRSRAPYVNLNADKSVPLSTINEVKEEIQKAGIKDLLYSSGIQNSRYPSSYPYFSHVGIQDVLPAWSPLLDSLLNSLDKLDPKRFTLRLRHPELYRTMQIKKYNRIEVQVSKERLLLNGQHISEKKLETALYSFIKKYPENGVIIYNPSDDIRYERYITYLDLIHTQFDDLRNELAMQRLGRSLDEYLPDQEMTEVMAQYPKNIIQWTKNEKRLLEVMKRRKVLRETPVSTH